MLDSLAPGFEGINAFSQKIAVSTIWIIIDLEIRLKGMADREYLTSSLKVRLNCSIPGKCSFLEAQFRYMPISAIYPRSGSNSLSACIQVILKPRCRYSLLTYLITSSIFFIFRVFNHTSNGKHNVSGYGIQESNAVDVHEVIA